MFTNEFVNKLSELIEKARKPTHHRARSALFHIKKAYEIKDIDANMAAFRMVTAEEEAATAIILAMKSRKYSGAEKLLHKDHVHKLAIFPFLKALKLAFKGIRPGNKVAIVIEEYKGKEIVRLRMPLPENIGEADSWYPIPPLNFTIGIEGEVSPYDFKKEFSEFAKQNNVQTIKKYIEDQFDFRNHLLYATDKGIGKVKEPMHDILDARKERVIIMLCIYLMIDPYFEKQLFVQNALNIFLKCLEILPEGLESEA